VAVPFFFSEITIKTQGPSAALAALRSGRDDTF